MEAAALNLSTDPQPEKDAANGGVMFELLGVWSHETTDLIGLEYVHLTGCNVVLALAIAICVNQELTSDQHMERIVDHPCCNSTKESVLVS